MSNRESAMWLPCTRRNISRCLAVAAVAVWWAAGVAQAEDAETAHRRPAFVFGGRRVRTKAAPSTQPLVTRVVTASGMREAAIEAALEQADAQQREAAAARPD